MNELEFLKAKFGTSINDDSLHNFSILELSELIAEFNQIKEHIRSHVSLDDREILIKDWIDYNERYKAWKEKYKDNLLSMDASMSQPNKPNYFIANND